MTKSTLLQIILFGCLCFFVRATIVQQAKAYETVKYAAELKNGVFHLDYADGYIGASKIRLVSNRQKTQLFTPQNGTPEANGNFVFRFTSGAEKREIILTGISEETEAPNTIRASYREKSRVFTLLFHKNKP